MSNFDWTRYEQNAAKLMKKHKVPGSSVAVAHNGKPIYARGFGWGDLEQKSVIDEHTVFGIGSVTKSFTGVAIMQLHEQGKLSVDDPVVKYLPEFKIGKDGAEKHMTIHHFLTHTAGIPPLPSLTRAMVRSMLEDPEVRNGEQGEKLKSLPPIDTDIDLMKYIAELDVKLFGFPGEYFSYSNDSYALLGSIIERVSGLPYETYVVEHVLKPLGMTRSLFATSEIVKMDNVATLYSSRKVKGKDQIYASPMWIESPAMSAAGFLKSTASDMLRYMDIFRTGGTCEGVRVLSRQSVDHMCAPFAQPIPGQFYGYGLMVHGNYRGVSLVEHGGNIKGVSAWVSCIREKGLTGVSLTNLVTSPASELLLTALNTTLSAPLRNPRYKYGSFHCPPEDLAQYEGKYVSGEGAALSVNAKGEGLEIELGEDRFLCLPISVDTFAMERKGQKMPARFLRNTAGEIWAMATGFRIIPKAPKE